MEEAGFKLYSYRWIVLVVFMLVIAINQLLWITFAPITVEAASFYKVSDLSIGLLSLIFMIVYIVISIPASWVIDTYGIRVAVGLGAALTGIFGLLRGIVATNYTWVLIAQIGIAVGQPLILNALTTVAARWFPINERATATGLGSLAMYLGIAIALVMTPYLTLRSQLEGMLVIYGISAMAIAVVFLVFAKESPPTPPCLPDQEERALVLEGLKDILRQKDFILLLLIFFVGLGVFNAVTTWIEDIVRTRGFSIMQAGNAGGLMILGGIIGAVIIPILSDRYRRRPPFLLLGVVGAVLGLAGVTYTLNYGFLLTSAFIFGFFLLSAGPVGFQYGAEVTYPVREGTSNGLLLMAGQISGIVFIVGMDSMKSPSGSMKMPLLLLIGLMVVCAFLCARLRDANILINTESSEVIEV